MTTTEAEVEPMAADDEFAGQGVEGVDPEEATPPMQIPIPGTMETISLNAGGSKPTSSAVAMRGASLPLEGQMNKGELVTLLVEARVVDVQFPDTLDPYGNVVKTTRRHILRPVSVTKAGDDDGE